MRHSHELLLHVVERHQRLEGARRLRRVGARHARRCLRLHRVRQQRLHVRVAVVGEHLERVHAHHRLLHVGAVLVAARQLRPKTSSWTVCEHNNVLNTQYCEITVIICAYTNLCILYT